MNDKTLGEIAYVAYCDSVGWRSVRGEALPRWTDQSEKLKIAWEAAADAVAVRVIALDRRTR
jgi:hypothetical protein